jgi:hypothetical protein
MRAKLSKAKGACPSSHVATWEFKAKKVRTLDVTIDFKEAHKLDVF